MTSLWHHTQSGMSKVDKCWMEKRTHCLPKTLQALASLLLMINVWWWKNIYFGNAKWVGRMCFSLASKSFDNNTQLKSVEEWRPFYFLSHLVIKKELSRKLRVVLVHCYDSPTHLKLLIFWLFCPFAEIDPSDLWPLKETKIIGSIVHYCLCQGAEG